MSTIYRVTIVAETDGAYETLGEVALPAAVVARVAPAMLAEVIGEHSEREQYEAAPQRVMSGIPSDAVSQYEPPAAGGDQGDGPVPAEGKPRRQRRTKAQMAADREAAAARVAPEQSSGEARAAEGLAGALDTRTEDVAGPTEPDRLPVATAGAGDDEPVAEPIYNPFA